MVGGFSPGLTHSNEAYLFDPADGSFVGAGTMAFSVSRMSCGAKPGSPHLIVCAGGQTPTEQKE